MAWHQSLLLAVPDGGVIYVQSFALQNPADFVQAIPLELSVLQVEKFPVNPVQVIGVS